MHAGQDEPKSSQGHAYIVPTRAIMQGTHSNQCLSSQSPHLGRRLPKARLAPKLAVPWTPDQLRQHRCPASASSAFVRRCLPRLLAAQLVAAASA